ncbi:MAG TPA: ferrous iron transport protein B [Thiobacillaceae bacterium]|nr:ferrous iron transport protein B [Thiobacillaceae bacterium]
MKRIALLGMPNTGKSTLFNRLTGAGARVGNWPGLTVELLSAKLLLAGDMVEVVDLPGIYNLHGFSEDEQVVRRFLESQPIDLIAVVLNGVQLDRQLALALQLKQLGLPMILLLNMADEAAKLGMRIDTGRLSASLGLPVHMISAKAGQGLPQAKASMEGLLRAGGDTIQANFDNFTEDHRLEQETQALLSQAVQSPLVLPRSLTERLDRYALHPWIGPPLFLLLLLGVFQAIYGLGTPLQDGMEWLLTRVKDLLLTPMLGGLPEIPRSFLAEGLYDGLGTVLSFLPIIFVFFLVMAAVEDSGYLARAAFLADALMARMGLDGRAFVLQLMGFGCNVPAIMGTRVMRSRGLRLLTMLTIPFSLCSARLQVFLFFTTAVFSPTAAPWVLFGLYLLSFAIAFLSAFLWRHRLNSHEPLLMEIPPYRMPHLGYLLAQGWRESTHFLREAGGFILLGVALVWLLTHFPFDAAPASAETLAGRLADFIAPVFDPLGIDQMLAIALLFGFVAKEIVIGALAVIYAVGPDSLDAVIAARVDWVSALSFMLFTLIYTPCVSTLAVIRQESRSLGFTLFSLGWSLGLAWVVSWAFYQTARHLS